MVAEGRVTIEPLSEQFSRAAGALIRTVLQEEFGAAIRACEDADLEDVLSAYAGTGSAAWVADRDGVVCGVAAVRETESGALELKRFYVRAECRGKGIGGTLLREVERRAAEDGYQQIVLTTTHLMARAQEVYRHFGYQLDSTERKGAVTLHTYRKRLVRAALGARRLSGPLPNTGTGEIAVVVERPRGSCEGWHWDRQTHTLVLTEYYDRPVPVNYGLAPEWVNPADQDALDVILLDDRRMQPGETLVAVPAGVLLRPDGDDKLLAVPAGGAVRPVGLDERSRARVSAWWDDAHQPVGWEGEEGIDRLFARCRRQGAMNG